mmetsp:Transcript_8142/g.30220  ORF Transcript_8142/g.30220 Transcript_8142/m.30220 type:complete len:222 (+) Transcript_8142:1847-2512(+)
MSKRNDSAPTRMLALTAVCGSPISLARSRCTSTVVFSPNPRNSILRSSRAQDSRSVASASASRSSTSVTGPSATRPFVNAAVARSQLSPSHPYSVLTRLVPLKSPNSAPVVVNDTCVAVNARNTSPRLAQSAPTGESRATLAALSASLPRTKSATRIRPRASGSKIIPNGLVLVTDTIRVVEGAPSDASNALESKTYARSFCPRRSVAGVVAVDAHGAATF